ncbi:hypothetical protein Tco_0885152 [Tanacetum coccineum]
MLPALHPIDVEHYDASLNIILIASDDDEDYEDDEHAVAPHHNLMNWNWDDVIVIPSDNETDDVIVIPSDDEADDVIVISSDDEADEKPVSVIGRKRVYALIDESDSDEEYSMINSNNTAIHENQDANMLDQTSTHITDLIRSLNMRTKDVVKLSLWWSFDDLDC